MESSRYDCSCDRCSERNRVRIYHCFMLLFDIQNDQNFKELMFVEYFRHAIVEELAGFGARIHVCDISETLLNQSLSEWEKQGFQVSGSVCDVTSRLQRETLMQTVSSLFNGKLNILVSKF